MPTLLLAAAALLLFGGKKNAAPPGKGGTPSSPGGDGQVPAALTPGIAASDVKTALVLAYTTKMGSAPPREESWLWPLAVSSLETAHWTQLYNFNAGNVVWTPKMGPWYLNPHVTSGLKFRSFPGLVQGARAMLDTMSQWGALQGADAGDAATFQQGMNGYLDGGKGAVYPDVTATAQALAHLVS